MSDKKLTDEQLEELKKLLTERKKAGIWLPLLGALAAVITAIGTAVSSIIIALRSN